MDSPLIVLRKYWKHQHFRPPQEEIVEAAIAGTDTFVVMPTGGGKSICFQVPAMIRSGICLVVTPLISLMRDQVEKLRKKNILAVAIHSGMRREEIDIQLDNCVYGHIKFLYVSPERLETELFRERFRRMKVGLVAIDEAHCISQWGYDFRPSYLKIAELRSQQPAVPFIALTATADKRVQADIMEKLEFRQPSAVFSKSFARANLSFAARKTANKPKKLLDILQKVPGSAIVYVRQRRTTKALADFLSKNGVRASYYHGGMDAGERARHQDGWLMDNWRVMVATNAFGMGIDKPDVRTVIHMDIPQNIESYYQEAGRAGRDGLRSFAVIVYLDADLERMEALVRQSYPEIAFLKHVYQCLANHYQLPVGAAEGQSFDFDLHEFTGRFALRSLEAYNAIKKLEEEGLVIMNESFYSPTNIHFAVESGRLYEFQVAHAQFDPLIKMLLRLYGGELFSEFVRISEGQLAEALQIDRQEVTRLLQHLSKLGVMHYAPAREKPQLTYTLPRQDAEHLPVDRTRYEARRKLMIGKANAMRRFVENTLHCRMLTIQEYFDEQSETACGSCDVCIARRKRENVEEIRRLKSKLLDLLSQHVLSIEDLEKKMNPVRADLFVDAVRDLLDDNRIAYDSAWNLRRTD